MILKNALIYYDDTLQDGALLILDGKIKSVLNINSENEFKLIRSNNEDGIEIDCEKRIVLPGI
ncbi:unnamed protein product, partial [marine sediment metagenome]